MGKRFFQIGFILLVLLAFTKAIREYLTKINSDPTDYEYFINDFPQGSISRVSHLTFTFAKDFDQLDYPLNQAISNDLIYFTPNIKGSLYWVNKRTLEFWPSHPLPSNQQYYYRVDLDKIFEAPTPAKVFRYQFATPEINYNIHLSPLQYVSDSLFRLEGSIDFTDYTDLKGIQQAIRATQGEQNLILRFTPTEQQLHFNFFIDSIVRGPQTDTLKLYWQEPHSEEGHTSMFPIPAIHTFKFMDASIDYQEQACLLVSFSNILDTSACKQINIIGEYIDSMQCINNQVKFYLKQTDVSMGLRLNIPAIIKAANGTKLEQAIQEVIPYNNQQPKIQSAFLTAIANSNSPQLSYKLLAKNVKQVEVKIYEILPQNILQYMQLTEYSDAELLRVGRNILSKEVSLKDFPLYNPNIETPYTLRFQNVAIKNEAGYHFQISYQQDDIDSKLADSLLIRADSISQLCFYSSMNAITNRMPNDSLSIFLFDSKQGYPLRNARVEIYDYQQHLLAVEQSNREGYAYFQLKPNAVFLKASFQDQVYYSKISPKKRQLNKLSHMHPFFFSNNTRFALNDTIDFSILFKTQLKGSADFHYSLIAPDQTVAYSSVLQISFTSINRVKHPFPKKIMAGEYTMQLQRGENIWQHKVNLKAPLLTHTETIDSLIRDEVNTKQLHYKNGESLEIPFTLPPGYFAYISLEDGSHILDTKWFNQAGAYKYSHPLSDNMWPYTRCHILILNELGIHEEQSILIHVENDMKQLQPQIIAPFDAQAGDNFAFKVREKKGQPMQYMIRLQFKDSLLPNQDPYKYYAQLRPNFIESYGAWQRNSAPEQLSLQFDPEANPNNLLLGPFNLDAQGIQEHQIPLPNILDKGQIQVIASNGMTQQYGFASKEIWLNTPVILNHRAPLMIQPKEQITIEMEMLLNQKSKDTIWVDLNSPQNCEIAEPSRFRFIADSASNCFHFPITLHAKPVTDPIAIQIEVKGSQFKHKEEFAIPLQMQNPKRISYTYNYLETKNNWQTRLVPGGVKGNNTCNIEFNTQEQIPLYYLVTKLQQLEYYDIQSQVSAVTPWLYYPELLTNNSTKSDSVQSMIQSTINHLLTYQQADGSFHHAALTDRENQKLNFYCTYFLLEASRLGYAINQRNYNNLLHKLEFNILFDYGVNADNQLFAQNVFLYGMANQKLLKDIDVQAGYAEAGYSHKFYIILGLFYAGKKTLARNLFDALKQEESAYTLEENIQRLEITRLMKQKQKNQTIRQHLSNIIQSGNELPNNLLSFGILLMEKSLLQFNHSESIKLSYRLNKGRSETLSSHSLYAQITVPFLYTLPKTIDISNNSTKGLHTYISSSSIPLIFEQAANATTIKITQDYSKGKIEKGVLSGLAVKDTLQLSYHLHNLQNKVYENLLFIVPLASGFELRSYADTATELYMMKDHSLFYRCSLEGGAIKTLNIPIQSQYAGRFWLSPARLIDLNTGKILYCFPQQEVLIHSYLPSQ